MDRITRKKLKTDRFVLEFEEIVEFLSEHRTQVVRYGAVAVVVVAAALGFYFYRKHVHAEREAAYYALRQVASYPVSPTGEGTVGTRVFRTLAEKDAYLIKGYTDLANKYAGSDEACMAEISIGSLNVEAGNLVEAQNNLQKAASCGNKEIASLAKLSLGQVYFAQGNREQGEKILKDLMANPTTLVTKDQATISLARMLVPTDPAEARKLLEPLRASSSAVSRVALLELSQMQQK